MAVLTEDDLRKFGRDGWLLVPGVADEALLADADAETEKLLRTRVPNMDAGDEKDGSAPGRHGWSYDATSLSRSRLFHERGTDALRATWGHVTMYDPPFPIGDPVEVRGRRGDLLLAHFLTGHNGGGNTGNQVRRTIYYRLATPGHATRWEASFLDPLDEYEPVRAAWP